MISGHKLEQRSVTVKVHHYQHHHAPSPGNDNRLIEATGASSLPKLD